MQTFVDFAVIKSLRLSGQRAAEEPSRMAALPDALQSNGAGLRNSY